MIHVDPHPLLDARFLLARWPSELGAVPVPPWLVALGEPGASTPFSDDPDEVLDGPHKRAVRDLLRHGGFKPSGRNKPCWEYLRGVVRRGCFPRINAAVDATNAAALHGALPVSTVDADLLVGAPRVAIAAPGTRTVFNAGGQQIDVSGLVCLFDDHGPCANAVKDAQRTKTHGGTRRTLTVVWGTRALPGRADAVAAWQRELFEGLGASVEAVAVAE